MLSSQLTAWNLLAASGVFLAFLVGFYTLVGRERKSPYLINSVFFLFLIFTIGAAFDIASLLVTATQQCFLVAGTITLLIAISLTIWRVYKIYMRFAHFVDSANPKYWWVCRKVKDMWRSVNDQTPYEHNTTSLPDDLRNDIVGILKSAMAKENPQRDIEEHDDFEIRSAALALEHQGQANRILAEIAKAFLKHNYAVQYLTASRHPIEFIAFLKEHLEADKSFNISWTQAASKIVVIDAYTRHFGFIDSIYFRSTRRLKSEYGVTYHTSAESYAGIHSAASVAFNSIKDKSVGSVRNPTLVIYEDCYALVDLESIEQYRVFIRHMLPSERLWDGMFTVVAETAQADPERELLRAYVSMVLDLRGAITSPTSPITSTAK